MTNSKTKSFFGFIKKYANYLLFLLVAVITIVIFKREVKVEDFFEILKNSNLNYLFLAFASMILYWVMEAYMIMVLVRHEYPKESFWHAFSVMMIGQFYNLVTPSSSGGQPFQLYEMVRKGIGAGFATAVLVQKYALYQLSVTLVGFIGIIAEWQRLMTWSPFIKIMVFLGLFVNMLGAVVVLLVAVKPNIARVIMRFFVALAAKIHIIKNPDKLYHQIDHFISEYRTAISDLKTRIPETLKLFAFNIAAILVYFGLTFFIYKSLGLSGLSIITITLIQAVLYLMFAFIPLPGGSGGAEIGFAMIFGEIFGAGRINVGMITWRLITFYFILLVGGIYVAIQSLTAGTGKEEKLKKVDALKKENFEE